VATDKRRCFCSMEGITQKRVACSNPLSKGSARTVRYPNHCRHFMHCKSPLAQINSRTRVTESSFLLAHGFPDLTSSSTEFLPTALPRTSVLSRCDYHTAQMKRTTGDYWIVVVRSKHVSFQWRRDCCFTAAYTKETQTRTCALSDYRRFFSLPNVLVVPCTHQN